MLLNELLGVKRFHHLTKIELLRMLNNAHEMGTSKLKFVGKGTAGTVLTDGTHVWKMWLQDDSYEAFIRYVIANQGNPFLPKVKGGIKTLTAFHRRVADTPEKIKYVKMEMLEEVSNSNPTILVDLDGAKVRAHTLVDYFIDYAHEFKTDEDIELRLKHREIMTNKINDKVMLLAKTAVAIGMLPGGEGGKQHQNDLGTFNWMMRGDTPVIIDPLANKTDHNFNHYLDKMDRDMTSEPDKVDKPTLSGPSKKRPSA